MPTQRFFNLKEEKRKVILDAAVHEFTRVLRGFLFQRFRLIRLLRRRISPAGVSIRISKTKRIWPAIFFGDSARNFGKQFLRPWTARREIFLRFRCCF